MKSSMRVCVFVSAASERSFSPRMLRQCQPASQQTEKSSRQRPTLSVAR